MSKEAKHDQGKLQLSLVPPALISAVAEVRRYGVGKYGDPENWRRVEVDRYREALLRHVLAVWDGDLNKLDGESGLPHLWHIACNVAFLIELLRGEENAKVDV